MRYAVWYISGAAVCAVVLGSIFYQHPNLNPISSASYLPTYGELSSGYATATVATITPPSPSDTTPAPSRMPVILSPQKVTLDENGATITLKAGESFLLDLGDAFIWQDVRVSDAAVLSRRVNVLVIRGAQGIYEAHQAGAVTLTAVGDPACRQSHPACAVPSIIFKITVLVT